MAMKTVKLKTAPELKALMARAMPSYRKHDVFLSEFSQEYGHSINSYWDGGSRSTFTVVDIVTGKSKALPTMTHPYFDVVRSGLANTEDAHVVVDGRGNVKLKHLPEGYALIEAGTFCGKPATAHIFLNANNLTKFIDAPAAAEITAAVPQGWESVEA